MAAEVINTMADNNYELAIGKSTIAQLLKVAIVIEGRAVANVPVDTGRLRGSITYALQGRAIGVTRQSQVSGEANVGDGVSKPSENNVAHIGTNVEYAQHVEFGTFKMTKQPFLRPALDASRSDVQRIMQKEIHEALKNGK